MQAVIGRKPAKDAVKKTKTTDRLPDRKTDRQTDRQTDCQAAAALAVTHRTM